jgi:hypothetical protein
MEINLITTMTKQETNDKFSENHGAALSKNP